jgi:hypothetical protein
MAQTMCMASFEPVLLLLLLQLLPLLLLLLPHHLEPRLLLKWRWCRRWVPVLWRSQRIKYRRDGGIATATEGGQQYHVYNICKNFFLRKCETGANFVVVLSYKCIYMVNIVDIYYILRSVASLGS